MSEPLNTKQIRGLMQDAKDGIMAAALARFFMLRKEDQAAALRAVGYNKANRKFILDSVMPRARLAPCPSTGSRHLIDVSELADELDRVTELGGTK